jgi:hypothetical protein
MVHVYMDSAWWRLTPDATGSYVNGTWSQLASLPAGYSPLFFASAVLPDGRVLVEGGEYNQGAQSETTLGAIYDPLADRWTPVAPPPGWSTIGDAESIVLPSGVFMLGDSQSAKQALFNASTLTWTATGAGKADKNSEEGWTLLPSGKVLTIDVTANIGSSELYDPATGEWSPAGNLTSLVNTDEIGPAVLRPNGTVFAMGASPHNAVYNADGTWSTAPDFPSTGPNGQLDIADGPAVLLPNGHVLCAASPGVYQTPVTFLVFDGSAFLSAPPTPNAPTLSSFQVSFLLLPTGEILATDNSTDAEIFTGSGDPDPAWAPAITDVPQALARGHTYVAHGTQFNGLSQAVTYGDDAQAATNYPLVRIRNDATGHVFYARTHDHSTMAVATGTLPVATSFDVPSGAETGPSHLEVVANGIASKPSAVTVQ